MKKVIVIFVFTSLLVNCKRELQDADEIVQKSIAVSGGNTIKSTTISFDFRDKHYRAVRDNGQFQLERIFKDSVNSVRDVLSNDGFLRFINNKPYEVSKEKEESYSASVNSVHYFSVLPYGLNSKAVKKNYLGKTNVKGTDYHKIKITFSEDGGGEDFEDVFIYWIDTVTFKVDYLAYSYAEKHGIGLRFREAYNERFIEGIRFVDYNNYKPKGDNVVLEHLDSKFENNGLELLSKIDLENILVKD
nr:DUF6503 family protein [uncultured Algibacter sp.]